MAKKKKGVTTCEQEKKQNKEETGTEDTLVFILRWCEKLREINKKQYRILFENEVYNIICVDDVQFTHKKLKLTAVREIRGGKNEQTGDI